MLQAEQLETRLCFASLMIGDVTVVEGDSGTRIWNVPVHLESPASSPVTVDYEITGGTATPNDDYLPPRIFTGFSAPAIVDNAGLKPWEVAVGDVDEDGNEDLLTVDPNNLVLKVFRNNGDGTFSAPSSLQLGGTTASSPALIDFNGDGHLDAFAAVRSSLGRFRVFPSNGDGTFGSRIDSGTNLFIDLAPLVIADLNGDNRPDVVTVSTTTGSDRVVRALLNDGTGRFNQSYTSSNVGDFLDSPAPNRNPLIDAGDINGDGRIDVVLATQEGQLWIFRGNGDGTFSQSSIANSINGDPLDSVKLADLNGDGTLDVVMVNSGSNQVAVRLNDGAGNFGTIVAYGVGDFPVDLDVADVDGDGRPDIITANQGPQFGAPTLLGDSVSLLRGLGDGTFLPAEHFSAGDFLSGGTFPSDVVAADFNNDGVPDLVVGHGGASSTQATILFGQAERLSSGRLVFAPEETVQNIPLDIIGDTVPEPDETIVIRLSNPVGATIADPEGVLTIEDDDTALGSISGVVYEDVNGNGARDPGEPLLAGGKLYLDANADGHPEAGFVTDSTGHYLFADLPAGDYIMHQQLPHSPQEGWVRTSPADGTYGVSLSAGQNITGRDFGNFEPYSISGHVFPDLNGNFDFGDNEPVLRDFIVYIDNNFNNRLDPGEVSTITGSDGRYRFTGLNQGVDGGFRFGNVVRVLAQPGWTPPSFSFVFANSGAEVTGINRYVAALANSVSGQVFHDLNGNGTRDADEPGMAGWTIYLDTNDNGRLDASETSTVTNEQGYYAFTDLPAGDFVVREVAQAGWATTAPADGSHHVTLVADQSITGLDFGSREVISTDDDLVDFRVQPTDLSGTPISSVPLGTEFFLEIYVRDIRADGRGVFAAYVDIGYDVGKVSIMGPLEYGDHFPNVPDGQVTVAGLIDEAGGVAGVTENGDDELLLLRVRLTAEALGSARFSLDPADDWPLHDVLLFDAPAAIPPANIDFGTASIEVTVPNAAPTAHDDQFAFGNCGSGTIDVLSNDTDPDGDRLIVEVVGTPNQGGSVEIVSDGTALQYTPAPGFFGIETFTYTISDGEYTSQATLAIEVLNPWHNYSFPEDVNGDGFVAPIDALMIINELNRGSGGRLQIPPASGCPAALLDANNDRVLAPIDALMVINHLNRRAAAEGEAPHRNTPILTAEGEAPASFVSYGLVLEKQAGPQTTRSTRAAQAGSTPALDLAASTAFAHVAASCARIQHPDSAFNGFADSDWRDDVLEDILSVIFHTG